MKVQNQVVVLVKSKLLHPRSLYQDWGSRYVYFIYVSCGQFWAISWEIEVVLMCHHFLVNLSWSESLTCLPAYVAKYGGKWDSIAPLSLLASRFSNDCQAKTLEFIVSYLLDFYECHIQCGISSKWKTGLHLAPRPLKLWNQVILLVENNFLDPRSLH